MAPTCGNPKCSRLMVIEHVDGDKTNNHAMNLRPIGFVPLEFKHIFGSRLCKVTDAWLDKPTLTYAEMQELLDPACKRTTDIAYVLNDTNLTLRDIKRMRPTNMLVHRLVAEAFPQYAPQ